MKRKFKSDLGELVNPDRTLEPLVLGGQSSDSFEEDLRSMWTIRLVEEGIARWIEEKKVFCPCHLGIGQEAIAVGVSAYLRESDRVFGNHRSHSHYLALGGSVDALFAEVLGKITGCSKGMGGSMHLYAEGQGFKGAVPIVGGTVPIAVGAGLAAQLDGNSDVAVSYFGDGTIEEGVVHESLNLATVLSLPVLFVCENNLYSSHLDVSLRQPSDRMARFAEAHRMEIEVVDGNDLMAIRQAASRLIENARQGRGPGFLEAVTYRWRGHVGPDENIDVGLRRKPEDLIAWKRRDPIKRLADALIKENSLDSGAYQRLIDETKASVDQAMTKAWDAPFPEGEALLDLVYSQK